MGPQFSQTVWQTAATEHIEKEIRLSVVGGFGYVRDEKISIHQTTQNFNELRQNMRKPDFVAKFESLAILVLDRTAIDVAKNAFNYVKIV